jgi:hypothetical protein
MPTQVRILDLPLQLNGLACIRSYRPLEEPSKLATGRWAEGQGRPQDVGKRWRGWYVADDGKQHTQRFRIEVEAEAWANKERGKVHTNQWVSPTVGGDTFRTGAAV